MRWGDASRRFEADVPALDLVPEVARLVAAVAEAHDDAYSVFLSSGTLHTVIREHRCCSCGEHHEPARCCIHRGHRGGSAEGIALAIDAAREHLESFIECHPADTDIVRSAYEVLPLLDGIRSRRERATGNNSDAT